MNEFKLRVIHATKINPNFQVCFFQVLTTMVNSSPDPRAMLTGLGIASILQDSLLETIAAKTSDNKVPKGDRETEII